MKNITTLKPFKHLCMTIGNLPSSYVDSMSYYECLLWLCKYLQETVIPAINNNADAVSELQGLYVQLKNYVDNYFTNLDVQEEINNKLDEMYESGKLQEIILKQQYVTVEQFKVESDIDDTTAFQLAINDGRPVYLLDKTYTVSDKLTINEQTRIIGKSMTDTIINFTDTTTHLFEYETPVMTSAYDHKTNIELSNFKVIAKRFIKINDNTLSESNWVKQGSLLHLTFKNLWLNGTYRTDVDNNKNTNVVPTLSELLEYGYAFNLNSIFDSVIENCNIQDYGVGIYLKGCDINTIKENRLNGNGVHIWTERINAYGSQNRIIHNDILGNRRYGGIRIESTRYDTIEDNYFENYTASGCMIKSNNDYGLSIINNRIDNPQIQNIRIMELSPRVDAKILNNRLNPNSNYKTYCYIGIENYGNGNTAKTYNVATFKNNCDGILIEGGAYTSTDYDNINVISPYHIDYSCMNIGGALYKAPWAVYDEDTGLYGFVGDTLSSNQLVVRFDKRKRLYGKFPKIRIYYKSLTNNTQYAQIKGDDSVLFGNNFPINNDGKLHYYDIDLTSNENIYDTITVTLPARADVTIFRIELI